MIHREPLPVIPTGTINTYWRHIKTGGDYCIENLAYDEATLRVLVIYRAVASNLLWVRPYDEFMDGRFKRVSI